MIPDPYFQETTRKPWVLIVADTCFTIGWIVHWISNFPLVLLRYRSLSTTHSILSSLVLPSLIHSIYTFKIIIRHSFRLVSPGLHHSPKSTSAEQVATSWLMLNVRFDAYGRKILLPTPIPIPLSHRILQQEYESGRDEWIIEWKRDQECGYDGRGRGIRGSNKHLAGFLRHHRPSMERIFQNLDAKEKEYPMLKTWTYWRGKRWIVLFKDGLMMLSLVLRIRPIPDNVDEEPYW